MKKTISLFGTDGIRQEIGQFPLDNNSIVKLGFILGTLFPSAKFLLGRDTRESGKQIETLLSTGIYSKNHTQIPCQITDCGVIPTPGLSLLTEHTKCDYGIMITASHNPYTDNGIKIFNNRGEKIAENTEKKIEELFSQLNTPDNLQLQTLVESKESQKYYDFLHSHSKILKPETFKLVLDCANGATFHLAPKVFKDSGFNTYVIHNQPNGKNINLNCGSTSLESLRETVLDRKADLGIAFDGDGDRVLFIDSNGHTLNGDHILYILSRYFLNSMDVNDFNKVIVGTVMGNLGLENALKKMGITYLRAGVGDKYVYREMKENNSILGGEESGHIIIRRFQKTGDGILTALFFIKALQHLEIHPSDVTNHINLYPQVTKNIRIKEKKDLRTWEKLNERIDEFNSKYGKNSRLLIRYSGTEPKIRIMIESEQQEIIDKNIGNFAELIVTTIGT